MAAEEFVLIPKHMYIRNQPHAAQILLDNSIKHKKPQLSYLSCLRPLNESARTKISAIDTTAVIPPTLEPPIVLKAENNPQKQALLLTSQDDDDVDDDEGNELQKNAELIEALSTESILLQLLLMDEYKIKRAKKLLEIINKSEQVKINKDNEEFYVDKRPTGLKASVFFV